MSRKLILTLAAAATIITAGLASGAADARGFGGGGFGGGHVAGGGRMGGGHLATHRSSGRLTSVLNPGRGGHPGHPGHPGHWGHHHGHWAFRNGVWIEIDGVDEIDEAPVVATPGPCTCLTKNYTPDGLVVFADVCTKEAASARVDGAAATELPPVDGKGANATQIATPPNAAADGKATDVTQAPTSPNYAGRTYKDYLAATAQAAAQSAQKN